MCQLQAKPDVVHLGPLAVEPAMTVPHPGNSSRRRRLWELDGHAYCPVIGVCLPLPLLRRLAEKTLGKLGPYSDYEVHCTVVTECRRRSPLSETLHKELENRYALVLRAAQQLKSTEALGAWWTDCRASADWAGALWAALTHPRCDAELEQRILGEVHMLQHQVGMVTRADLTRLETLHDENAILARELAHAQQRSLQQASLHSARLEQQQAETLRLRAELVQAQTRLHQQQEALEQLQANVPGLAGRMELTQQGRQQAEEIRALQRQLAQARSEAQRQGERADQLQNRLDELPLQQRSAPQTSGTPDLEQRAVLCVGGRTASVPIYRQVIEHTGARFLHHDGGTEDNSSQLDATLAAADLVICQSGCISHNAYWRVKDHCKRTGKQCVFIETPSRSALERALSGIDVSTN
ncbi:DUF2325 domain-containing protein [Rhodoferax sp. BAB1]|uniref:DUF2325 domain-containing protein n=1 Tax=Rhodoferax sp. BAB1 TaxID=2741720 RepID=UPI0015766782|nr:DUF2325 domain-containing protein [Rhodoferax sp. BAB1]QKO22539.1 DUF2325 domain-containing protein [Rhodoferax sp. BAB1]